MPNDAMNLGDPQPRRPGAGGAQPAQQLGEPPDPITDAITNSIAGHQDAKPGGWQGGPDAAGAGNLGDPINGGAGGNSGSGNLGEAGGAANYNQTLTGPMNNGPMATLPHGGGGPQPAQPAGGDASAGGPDPFAASGGGTYFVGTGQWVPNNNSAALSAAQAANNGQAGAPGAPAGGAVPGDRGAGGPQPATEPGAPGAPAAPGAPTAPPPPSDSSDIYNKALLAQMNQNVVPDANDPAIRAQLDPLRVENQRAMEGEMRSEAEAGFANGSSVGAPERAAAAERMGEKTGVQAAQITGQELSARRAQMQDALSKFGARLSDQERNALQDKIAQMDNAIKQEQIKVQRESLAQEGNLTRSGQAIQREGIQQTGSLGAGDLALRRDLGMGGLNNDLLRIILGNKLGNNQLGAQVGMDQATLNQNALASLMGQ